MGFHAKLRSAWDRADSLLCVGLDPDLEKFPDGVDRTADGVLDFCRRIADATAHAVCAFKPQIAYFAALGAERQLEILCEHIRREHPDVVLILDAKRGDIGPTAERYAAEAFDRYGADAVTVNPYLGGDTLEPFFARAGRGTVVLCRTSNPGSADLQMLEVGADRSPLYQHVARLARDDWARRAEIALVVGATYPRELAEVRAIVGDLPLLVPGIGAQGGDVEATVRAGATPDGRGMIINSSRAVLYASRGADWLEAARLAAESARDDINTHR